MKKLPLLCCLLLLASQPLLAQVATGPEATVDDAVRRIAGSMASRTVDTLWDDVARLQRLGEEALEPIEEIFAAQPVLAQLGLAAAMSEMGEREEAARRALRILKDGQQETELRILASYLISGAAERSLDRGFRTSMREEVEAILDDPFAPLPLRVALARTLYQGFRVPRGRRELHHLLKSEDLHVRNQSAMALAEIGDVADTEVKEVLLSMRDEPGERGRLVRAYLTLEEALHALDLEETPPDRQPSEAERYALLAELEQKIREYHIDGDGPKADHERLLQRAAKGMVESMDRHSTWYSGKEFREFIEDLNRNYGGIGAYVGFRGEPPMFTILRPIYSGPAYEAGLRSRDVILEVDGWPTDGQPQERIISRLKGRPGTPVDVTVFRPGWKTERHISITRGSIEIPSVQGELLYDTFGYVGISGFSDDTGKDLRDLLDGWHDAGQLGGIILDLRNNGGGYLDTAVQVADQFLPRGTLIVYSEGRNPEVGARNDFKARFAEAFPGIPLVVLINGASASASEIVTGALQVHRRATIIGTRSFGKGSVQKPLEVAADPMGRLRLTIARYYLPDGTSIHKEIDAEGAVVPGKEGGILPDILVEPDYGDVLDVEEVDRLEQAGAPREYVAANLDQHAELFDHLARFGTSRGDEYPDFEAFYESLETSASRESIRFMLRRHIIEVMQDRRGAEYVPVSPIDQDEQLQAAVIHLARLVGLDTASQPDLTSYAAAYDTTLERQEELRRRYAPQPRPPEEEAPDRER